MGMSYLAHTMHNEVDGYIFLWFDYHGVITCTFLIGESGLNPGFI